MATGDNLLTAASVAKKCNILDPKSKVLCGDLATNQDTGKTFIDWQIIQAESQLDNLLSSRSISQ